MDMEVNKTENPDKMSRADIVVLFKDTHKDSERFIRMFGYGISTRFTRLFLEFRSGDGIGLPVSECTDALVDIYRVITTISMRESARISHNDDVHCDNELTFTNNVLKIIDVILMTGAKFDDFNDRVKFIKMWGVVAQKLDFKSEDFWDCQRFNPISFFDEATALIDLLVTEDRCEGLSSLNGLIPAIAENAFNADSAHEHLEIINKDTKAKYIRKEAKA